MAAFALRNTARGLAAEINITPLVDVMLVLLVIFILAAPLATQRLTVLNSPPCAHGCRAAAEPVRLSVKRTGELYWNGSAITRAALAANLAALARDPEMAALEIHPEAATRYALVTDVLAAAHNARVSRISVAP